MIHFGDITKLSGWDLPIVDCIIGGSPCQDLSVAGPRKGLDGERSVLFMDQVRIVKEMRERDRLENGRSGYLRRPRFMVWENVPGAFSSNERKDFQAVLTEIVRIAEPDAPDVPMPNKGKWPNAGCLYSDMGGWSIAWRVHDAQFWGVPQRRKRIALVADFGGLAAPEVLFERKGVSRNPQPSEEARKEAPGNIGGCAYPAIANTLTQRYDGSPNPDKKQGANIVVAFKAGAGSKAGGIGIQEETVPTLNAAESGTQLAPVICYGISGFESNAMKSANPHSGIYEAETARTLDNNGGSPNCNQGGMMIVQPRVFDARGNGDGATVPTITGDHQDRITDYTAICVGGNDIAQTLDASYYKGPGARNGKEREIVATFQNTGQGWWNESEVGATLRTPCGGDAVKANLIAQEMVVRRLTPLECERLQGYPDHWTDIGEWIDSKGKRHKEADSPRYKALGNSIALPFWFRLCRRISAMYDRPATLGSLFDGIGGFPLVWERCNGPQTAIWASEIEEFCIAVTKRHFPEEGSADGQ